jgi:antitoxin PrlF
MKAVVSEKGQVTIPKAARDRLGIAPGTVIEFETRDGELIGRKSMAEDVFEKWEGRGRLPGGSSVDDYLNRVRGGRANRS